MTEGCQGLTCLGRVWWDIQHGTLNWETVKHPYCVY